MANQNTTQLYLRVEQRRHQLRQEETGARQRRIDMEPRQLNFNFPPDMWDNSYVLETRVARMHDEIHVDKEEWQSSPVP